MINANNRASSSAFYIKKIVVTPVPAQVESLQPDHIEEVLDFDAAKDGPEVATFLPKAHA